MDIANAKALGAAQAEVQDALEAVHQARPQVDRGILKGPNVELTVALVGLDAALQIAKNLGPTPEQQAEREAREKEQREEDDLKKEHDEDLADDELQRERQVTENIIGAEMARGIV